jgi:hypothetical protein
MIQGHTDLLVFTLLSLFLMTITFMIDSCAPQRAMAGASSRCSYGQGWVPRYRRSSMTTSTSHGRTVPFFFGSCVFLLRICVAAPSGFSIRRR